MNKSNEKSAISYGGGKKMYFTFFNAYSTKRIIMAREIE